MDRRAFIGILAGGLLAGPLAAAAQQAGKPARVGVLLNLYPPDEQPPQALRQRLRDLGYVDRPRFFGISLVFAPGRRRPPSCRRGTRNASPPSHAAAASRSTSRHRSRDTSASSGITSTESHPQAAGRADREGVGRSPGGKAGVGLRLTLPCG